MIRRLAVVALLLASRAAGAQTPATPIVRIDDAGPGMGPAFLAQALASAPEVIRPDTSRYVITRASQHRRTIVSLRRDVVVEGTVQGDVIVVGANLYMHPGGTITGRAVSIGGGVYESGLASIGFGVIVYNDFTYTITPTTDGYALSYRALNVPDETGLRWPGLFGVSTPTYDRTNGVSIGFGPEYAFYDDVVVVSPQVTYRSQLGQVDATGAIEAKLDRRTTLRVRGGRSTVSNDRWIRGDFVNSVTFLYNGDDTRNYYRATGGDASVSRLFESVDGALAPYVGLRYERASSARPGLNAEGGPWTVFARGDADLDDRLRPNPPISEGSITSGIAGIAWTRNTHSLAARARADLEGASGFGQITAAGFISFPTFGTQSLHFDTHIVATAGGNVPHQRFAYIGGPGTIPTIELLSEGGDQLLYVDAGYNVPFDRIQLPFVGAPVITLREALGGARVGSFPTLHQSSGVRVTVGGPYVEWMVDPARRTGHLSFGLTLSGL